ncbi:hypothetical protein [Bacillus alkalicellulosilyticus]|uniref:hypothetical protein n=1 Tax=Alkalihalobacterium alkalicellulosilyticum TaxID=1912214 RepID=UPI00099696EE|nr:hypothetical protein [Bacillus alkalicellulosilyticus]
MKKIMITIFIICVFLIPKQSYALSCVEPSPPDVAYNEYDAVIIGTVQKIKENNGIKMLTIKVDKSFKGVDKKIIEVEEDFTWGESELNSSYLYFLNENGDNWVLSLCSPTTSNIDAADKYLSDKEAIPLSNVIANENEPSDILEEVQVEDEGDTNNEESNSLTIIVLVAIIFILSLFTILIRKRMKK